MILKLVAKIVILKDEFTSSACHKAGMWIEQQKRCGQGVDNAIRSVRVTTLTCQSLKYFVKMSSKSLQTVFIIRRTHFLPKAAAKTSLIRQHILNVRHNLWNEAWSLISFYYWIKVFQMLIKITWESRRKTMNHSQRRNESFRES